MPSDAKPWTADQERFIAWLALPKAERQPSTQRAFARDLGVDEGTLSDWKRIPGFLETVNGTAREYVKHDVSEILATIRKLAIAGSVPHINMALAMTGMAADVQAAGAGPGSAQPVIREVVVRLTDGRPVEP